MQKLNYLQLQVKLLTTCASILKYKGVEVFGKYFKLVKMLKTALFFVVLGVFVAGSYCYVFWDDISFSSLTEPLGFAFTLFRLSSCYLLFYLNRSKFVKLVDRMNTDRSSVKPKDAHFAVCKRFCKMEVVASVAFAMFYLVSVPMMFTVGCLLNPNDSKLPLNFKIVGLSNDYPVSVWILNYLVQLAIAISTSGCYVIIQSLTMVHLNHSCYLIDSTLVYVRELDTALNRSNDPPSHPLQMLCIHRKLRKVKDMVENVVDWQHQANKSLQLVFFVIFTMHFSVLCGLIVSVSKNPAESFAAIILTLMILSDLFANCWVGSRVVQRFGKLATELHGINWDLMVPNQRKDLLLILLLSQNIKSNHGVFMPVDMTTFQAIIEFNFSVTALLRATAI